MAWKRVAAAGVAGLVFGLGLAVAGMVDPRKVQNFLDLAGAWDPSLLFVLGAAVLVAGALFPIILKRPAPLFDGAFHLPTKREIDLPLVAGMAIFGVGWGLAGWCPGPVFASIGLGNAEAAWVLPALLAGAALARWQMASRRH